MGWVGNRIRETEELPKHLPSLWNSMRDSIGMAVSEFKQRYASDAAEEHLSAVDCSAMGRFCRRVTKAFGSVAIEVFLEEKAGTLNTSAWMGLPSSTVCRYRLAAGKAEAEFFTDGADGPRTLHVEGACRMALESFIFIKLLPK
jgi:hypothetical protein